jgi:hypothetical protein
MAQNNVDLFSEAEATMKISIIVPTYRRSQYLKRCFWRVCADAGRDGKLGD